MTLRFGVRTPPLTLVLLLAGCSSAPSASASATPLPSPSGRLTTFQVHGLSFKYPVEWKTRLWNGPPPSFYSVIVYLSPQSMHDVCVTVAQNTQTCGTPINSLGTGSVVVTWSAHNNVGWPQVL